MIKYADQGIHPSFETQEKSYQSVQQGSDPQKEISGSESFTRWLVGYKSKYESIQPFHMGEYESTALKELH